MASWASRLGSTSATRICLYLTLRIKFQFKEREEVEMYYARTGDADESRSMRELDFDG